VARCRGDRRSVRARPHQSHNGVFPGHAAILAGRHSTARRFLAKFYVFLAAIKAGLFALAVIGVVTSVVGAYYYLTIVKIMYFEEPAKPFAPMAIELKIVLAVTGLFNLLFFVYPGR